MILRLLMVATTFTFSLSGEPARRPPSRLTYFGACMTGPSLTYNCWGWTVFVGDELLVPCCVRLESGVHHAVCRPRVVRTCDRFDVDGDDDIDLLDYAWLLRAQVALEVQND